MSFTIRKKSILSGLYLSKFDKEGLSALGLQTFTEAFNVLAFSFGGKPASIKNYRDEFDPYFPNKRKGWHKREFREYCRVIYDEYSNLDFIAFQQLIKSFSIKNYDIEEISNEVDGFEKLNSFAKRLLTGNAAETYFSKNYNLIRQFEGYQIKDTTSLGCGFDFKLTNEDDFYLIEVKGISKSSGSILITEKEYSTAEKYKNKFCLFVVKNFVEKPYHEFIFNPIESNLTFNKVEKQISQISYSTSL